MAIGLATPASASSIVSLQLDAPNVTVTFQDTEPRDSSNTLILRPTGPGGTVRKVALAGEIPSVNRTLVKTLNAGITPGIGYCAVVEVGTRAEEGIAGKFGTRYQTSEVCAEPAGSANAPADVSIGGITGEANPPTGTNRNYWVSYSNAGAEAKGVVIQVQTSGSLSVRRAPESGTFNGFQCSATGSTGYRCTGGTLAKGAKNQIPVLATITKAGPGAIHATITAEGDTNPGNNANTHSVMAVPPGG
ncbi:hypothetical protein [Streptomyces sp. NBC_01408]|uniref:hypothetical protein n=1 Tax=Streptomyces sp. NBC_01408 TaxID=2903855 RepID=UPI0022509682|nr:hypothetical protein [Streptomyces sp. NBC_01408]MCX4694944.1 DUF11 domain-containing protein [Streptomyces sp. NBC_01408]